MSKVISSFSQLYTEINGKLEIAISGTIDELLRELNNIIMEEVYSRPIGEWDGRTYQFLNSWDKEQVVKIGNMMTTAISQRGYDSIWNSDMWSHGNAWSELHLQSLDAIINDGLDSSNFGFPAIEARPYWTTFLYWVQENLGDIFMRECIKVKLPITRVGVL